MTSDSAPYGGTSNFNAECFRKVESFAHFGYWAVQAATEEVWLSEGCYIMLEVDSLSFTPSIAEINRHVVPEDALSIEKLAALLAEGKEGRLDFRLVRSDNSIRHVELRFFAERDASGNISALLGAVYDITDRKQMELSLLREEEQSKKAQALAHFGYWDWDIATGKVIWTDEIYRIFGLDRSSFAPTIDKIMQFSLPDDRSIANALIGKSIEKRVPGKYELRIFRPSGEERWYESSFEPIFDKNGNLVRMIGTAHDITQAKKAMDLVKANEESLRITLDSISDAVLTTNASGFLERMNPAAESLTGWSFSEAKGKHISEVFTLVLGENRQPFQLPINAVLLDGVQCILPENCCLVAKAGAERLIGSSLSPIRNTTGEIEGMVLVLRDVTERQRMEAQLRQSQKLESIGMLAGGIAHDFNNMLGGIMGSAEILSRRVEGDKCRQLVDLILNGSRRAADLTQKLLSFSRKGKLISSPMCVHQALQDAVAILERSIDRKVVIRQDFRADKHVVIGDPSQLQNAFLNLGVNAEHAMPDGGTLSIITENVALNADDCSGGSFEVDPGDYIRVTVADTGVGMEPEVQRHIFEPFFTTKDSHTGTGLGLVSVLAAVKDHHGMMKFSSQVGQGTEFQLFLPVEERAIEHSLKVDYGSEQSGNILLIDDEDIMRKTSALMLAHLGYKVLIASGGREGVRVLQENLKGIDLVMLDMVMPDMSGRECYAKIREISSDLPILVCSGFAKAESVGDFLRQDIDGFLKKPYGMSQLSHALNCILSKKPSRS